MTTSQANAILRGFMAEMQQMEIERIKREPEKNKRTLIMAGSTGYHAFWGGEDKRARYWYCAAKYVNVAGYVLVWREVCFKKRRKKKGVMCGGFRDQWAAKKSGYAAIRLAKARAQKALAKMKGPAGATSEALGAE